MQRLLNFRPQGLNLTRPWRSHPRETIAAATLGVIAIALANAGDATPLLPQFAKQASPEVALHKPLPTEIRNLPPETALHVNARIPLADGPNPAAAPFLVRKASAETRDRALECLTSAIYYEAAQEPTDGQRAVAQVVLNRVRHPAFPNSVCGVVYEGSTRV
ncbi:MAG TPA: cell wall hydrolase, partial [Sphingomicrobium sp.]